MTARTSFEGINVETLRSAGSSVVRILGPDDAGNPQPLIFVTREVASADGSHRAKVIVSDLTGGVFRIDRAQLLLKRISVAVAIATDLEAEYVSETGTKLR